MHYSFDRLLAAGVSFEDAVSLRRISMTLHRWHELECGDGNNWASWCIARGRKVGKVFEYDDEGFPYLEWHSNSVNEPTYTRIPDRENGAKRRLAQIMARYPGLDSYIQTDPRGCALYVGEGLTDSDYNRGIAICK